MLLFSKMNKVGKVSFLCFLLGLFLHSKSLAECLRLNYLHQLTENLDCSAK